MLCRHCKQVPFWYFPPFCEAEPLVSLRVGEDSLVVFRSGDGGVRAFVSQADTLMLGFDLLGEPPEVHDAETNSVWNLEVGLSTGGSLKGALLEEVKVLPAFWFAWSNFYPRTEVID